MFVLYLFCVFIQSAVTQWVYEDIVCTTPDKTVGNCIGIRNCQPMLDFLETFNGYVDEETSKTILAYKCGDESSQPKVCCPSSPIKLPSLTESTSTTDVSSHTNLRYLPMKECGISTNVDKILNGNKTQIFEFPWMAVLKYSYARGTIFNCGGTLISKRYILTAAHCIVSDKFTLIGVRLGEHDLNKEMDCEKHPFGSTYCAPPVQNFDVTRDDAIIHPDYNKDAISNDIALIRLRHDADVSKPTVNSICLPIQPTTRNNQFKKKITVAGWGLTENGTPSSVLLKVIISVVENSQCERNYKNVIRINRNQICAGGKNWQDTCTGDSGGPLMDDVFFDGKLKTVQYGIVSFGPQTCGKNNNPSVYTRVTSYLPWILDNIIE